MAKTLPNQTESHGSWNITEALGTVGDPIIVVSFPRSGTHLTIDLLRKHVKECRTWKHFGERLDHLYQPLEGLKDKPRQHPPQAVIERLQRPQCPILKTHSTPAFQPWLDRYQPWIDWIRSEGKFVYVYRDGREALCSLYTGRFGMFENTEDMSFSEFLRMDWEGMNMAAWWASHVEQWLSVDHVAPVQFKEIIQTPQQVIERLTSTFNLTADYREPLLPRPIRSRWHGRWIRLTSRCPESTALVPGRYRQIKTPKWTDTFSADDRLFFHREAGQTLIRFDMEASDDWVNTDYSVKFH